MKKTYWLLSCLIIMGLISFSFANTDRPKETILQTNTIGAIAVVSNFSHDHKAETSLFTDSLFSRIEANAKGLSRQALQLAVQGYLNLKEGGKLINERLLSIVDFSQSSRSKRFYLLDVQDGLVLQNTYVAHGKNSGVDMADSFSNTIGSEKSSLGFYMTRSTYTGKNGLSLRMVGLDKGFNDNAEARSIVVHGADYVNSGRVNAAYMGRSQGCPALPRNVYQQLINEIKDGSLLFVYYPLADYISNSSVLGLNS